MKTLFQFIFFLTLQCAVSLSVFAQCTGFAKTASSENSNSAYGITLDEQNNSYVAGFYTGPTTFGNTTANDTGLFVIKYDSLGNQLWVKTFPGIYLGIFSSINFSHDAIFLGATFSSTATFDGIILTSSYLAIAAVKLNTNGDVQWAKTFSCTSASYCYGIRNTTSGKVLITGRYRGALTMGGNTLTGPATGYCIYLAELNASTGDVLWARSSTVQASNNGGRGYAIRTDLQGNILLSGYYQYILQFGSQTLDNSANLYGLYAPYVAKFDSSGACVWIRGGTGDAIFENVYGLTLDSLNNIYFSCPLDASTTFSGQTFNPVNGNFVIGKYNSSGTLLWAKQWGSHITDSISCALSLHVSHNTTLSTYGWGLNEMIFGSDTLKSAGGDDIFRADFDANGNYLSSYITGNIYSEFFYDAAFDQNDHAYIAGSFFGDTATLVDFGLHGDALVDSFSRSNIFVWKNCPAGIGNSIQSLNESSLKAFPNPSDGLFIISGVDEAQFIVQDLTGRIVTQGKIQDHQTIDLSNVSTGVYSLKIFSGEKCSQTKLVRQ